MILAATRGLFKLLLVLWPFYALFAARWAGDRAWNIAASSNPGLHSLWEVAPTFGSALGPVLFLGAALMLVMFEVAGKNVLTYAIIALVASIAWTFWGEFSRLAPYFGVEPIKDVLVAFDRGPIFASLIAAFAIFAALRIADGKSIFPANALKRSDSSVHGNADWMTMNAAKELLNDGDIVLGEAYRVDRTSIAGTRFKPDDKSTWGEGGTHPMLKMDAHLESGHVLAVMGSGGGKTASLVIPTATTWSGSLVALDVKGEVHDRVASLRAAAGRRVVALRPEGRSSASFNVLDFIDTSTDLAIADVRRIVTWLMGEKADESSTNEYFRATAASLLAALVTDVVFDPNLPPADRNLRTVRRLVAQPRDDLLEHLAHIYEKGNDYAYGYPAEVAGNLKDLTPKQFDGFYGQLGSATEWLSIPSLANLVSGLTSERFDTKELRTGNLDVFLCIDLGTLNDTPELARVVLGSLLNELYRAKGKVAKRTLFLVDEAARLGYMKLLEEARDAGRGFKINLMLMFQTIGQLEIYGKSGVKQWFDGVAVKVFSSIGDPDTAEYISKSCGEFTAISSGRSTGSGSAHSKDELFGSANRSSGRSTSEVARRLIKPEEVVTMRGDEQLILVKGEKPIRCGKAFWFRRSDLSATIGNSSFEDAA